MSFSFNVTTALAIQDGERILFGFLLAVLLFFVALYFRTKKPVYKVHSMLMFNISIFELWVLLESFLASVGIPIIVCFIIQLIVALTITGLWYAIRRDHLRIVPKSLRRESFIAEGIAYGGILIGSLTPCLSLLLFPSLNEIIIYVSIAFSQIAVFSLSLFFILIEEKKHEATEEQADKAVRELNYFHLHDPLTGLHNRDSFFNRLKIESEKDSENPVPLAFFYLDLDHFHEINDNLTNAAGNVLLRSVAERLVIVMADATSVFRTGEDEFAIIASCPHAHVDAAMIAEDLLAVFNKPFTIKETEVFLSASIGIAFLDQNEQTVPRAAKLNRQLDQALAQAKLDHNTYRFYTPNLGERGLSSLQYVNYLRQAIDRHELSLHFQPQIDKTGAVVSAEALVRWNNPELGSVPPSAFIPIAEEAGLIIPIGDWVIEHACAELAHWHSLGLVIPMAINLSTRQLKDVRLERSLLSKLKKYGLHPSYLHLEITESSLLEESERTIQTLINLSKAGFKLSIDDFGTGYANLSWLKRLPVSTVKIDRSFVVELPENAQDMALVQAIVDMAKSMGLSIIAEGVESLRQLEVLRAAECSIIQGFFYSRPLPSVEFLAFAQKQSA